jgi:hypothetical protein
MVGFAQVRAVTYTLCISRQEVKSRRPCTKHRKSINTSTYIWNGKTNCATLTVNFGSLSTFEWIPLPSTLNKQYGCNWDTHSGELLHILYCIRSTASDIVRNYWKKIVFNVHCESMAGRHNETSNVMANWKSKYKCVIFRGPGGFRLY